MSNVKNMANILITLQIYLICAYDESIKQKIFEEFRSMKNFKVESINMGIF